MKMIHFRNNVYILYYCFLKYFKTFILYDYQYIFLICFMLHSSCNFLKSDRCSICLFIISPLRRFHSKSFCIDYLTCKYRNLNTEINKVSFNREEKPQ